MSEKPKLIDQLPALLITPDRTFVPRTPHTYVHVGAEVLQVADVIHIASAYPDLPEHAKLYEFPEK